MNCTSPVRIRNPNFEPDNTLSDEENYLRCWMIVPCGKCLACRASRAREWSYRLLTEMDSWQGKTSFITLTYDDDHLPSVMSAYMDECDKVYYLPSPTLRKKDFQDFMKRLRKDVYPEKLKYFYCGEYGERTGRPHYHVILFGLDVPSAQVLVGQNWKLGNIKVGSVTSESIRYVAGYVQKKLEVEDYLSDYLEKPFKVSSKGLSIDFVRKNEEQIKQRDYLTMFGSKMTIPRYFRKKLDIQPDFKTYDELVENAKRTARDLLQAEQRAKNLQAKSDLRKLKQSSYSKI